MKWPPSVYSVNNIIIWFAVFIRRCVNHFYLSPSAQRQFSILYAYAAATHHRLQWCHRRKWRGGWVASAIKIFKPASLWGRGIGRDKTKDNGRNEEGNIPFFISKQNKTRISMKWTTTRTIINQLQAQSRFSILHTPLFSIFCLISQLWRI